MVHWNSARERMSGDSKDSLTSDGDDYEPTKTIETYSELLSNTTALSDKIIQIQSQWKKTEQELQSQIDKLKADQESLKADQETLIPIRDEGLRLMLIRTLATSFQYALTQKFPGVFKTRYPFSCTFNEIDKKVTTQNDESFHATLAAVKSFFLERGIQSYDINTLIKNIREMGTPTIPFFTKMLDVNGVPFKPSAADLHEVINVANLPASIKDDARILLDALDSIVPAGCDLLYYRD